jgi:transposase InsO family protein/transposase-like protein
MGLKIYSNFMASVSKDKYFTIRKAIVLEALEKGIKPTAFRLNMSKNTIRLWLRRFQNEGNDGLLDRRSGPNHIPHKTSLVLEKQIIAIRKTASCYGARRLKYFFNLTSSIGAIQRILNDHGLCRKKRRRYQKKNDLRSIKAKYKAGEKLQMDVKYLTDIPPYWEMMQRLKLPRFQYTIRDVKSGMLFLGYANVISEMHAESMAQYVLKTIVTHFPGTVTLQTDNGVEFSGTTRNPEANHFRRAIKALGAEHCYIPPGHCNANADVESIHATIEEEFYNLTSFSSRKDFFQKAESYRLFYNLERPNFSKGGKTPRLIAQEDHSKSNFATVFQSIGVLDLDYLVRFHIRGQPLPVLPDIQRVMENHGFCLYAHTYF